MSAGSVILIGILAAIAAGVAIAAGTNAAVAAPIAAVSVGVVAFLFLEIGGSLRWPSRRFRQYPEPAGLRIQSAYGFGSLDRLEVIALLDTLERAEGGFTGSWLTSEEASRLRRAGPRTPEVLARLQALSAERFRAYVDSRVSELERRM
ncbi:MAG TPA: hypothetical protein VEH28_05770 [Thermoplasmata archaeon]|nr:hypothetical protein [Thermoplasmata archaeon]